jgi:uncharacterized protein (DUF2126 family)
MRRGQIVLIVDDSAGGRLSMETWSVPRSDASLDNTTFGGW